MYYIRNCLRKSGGHKDSSSNYHVQKMLMKVISDNYSCVQKDVKFFIKMPGRLTMHDCFTNY